MALKFVDLDEQERRAKRCKEKMADEPEIKTVTVDDIPEILSKQIAMTNDVIAKQDSMRMLTQILGNQNALMASFQMLYAKMQNFIRRIDIYENRN